MKMPNIDKTRCKIETLGLTRNKHGGNGIRKREPERTQCLNEEGRRNKLGETMVEPDKSGNILKRTNKSGVSLQAIRQLFRNKPRTNPKHARNNFEGQQKALMDTCANLAEHSGSNPEQAWKQVQSKTSQNYLDLFGFPELFQICS